MQCSVAGRVLELTVANGEGFAEVACSAGGVPLWRDRLPGQVAHVAGNLNFSAAALQNATLQVRLHLFSLVTSAASKLQLLRSALEDPHCIVVCCWQSTDAVI